MTWRDEIRQGSFRGVSFKFESSGTDVGRRTVSHQYPLRDTPYSEDLGRKQREFSIEAFVLGDDYMRQRDALLDACEQSGEGELVHPYLGIKRVVCTQCKVSESSTEGRIARFSLTFAEAGERKFPSSSKDAGSFLGISCDSVLSSASAWFEKGFTVAQLPQQFLSRAVSQVQKVSTELQKIRGIADTASRFYSTAQQLATDAAALVTEPAELVSRLVYAVDGIADLRFDIDGITGVYTRLAGGETSSASAYTQNDISQRIASATDLLSFGDPADEEFSPTPYAAPFTWTLTQEQVNTEAIINIVKLVAVSVIARTMVEKDYATLDDALLERDLVSEQIDYLSEQIDDDEVYQNLIDMRAALVLAVPQEGKDLPSLISIWNQETRPSLVICYDLYEALTLETDLIRRNRVSNPGFVSGGLSLKVIRNA